MNISPVKRQKLRIMPYQEFLSSDFWKEVRKKALSRAKYRCQLCNAESNLQVHHRTYEHRGWEDENLSDLTVLCAPCHQKHHEIGSSISKPERIVYVVSGIQDRFFVQSWLEFIQEQTNGIYGFDQLPSTSSIPFDMLHSHDNPLQRNRTILSMAAYDQRDYVSRADVVVAIPPFDRKTWDTSPVLLGRLSH